MIGYLRTLATDFDGTLTHDGRRPEDRVLASLRRIRSEGALVVLVTGRILSELHEVFPDAEEHFDAIVAENGAVLWNGGHRRLLATPVDPGLVDGLAARGVRVRHGEVLVAGSASDRIAVLEEIHDRGLDYQLIFNRNELMILPAGVNKGTGLFDALGDLGVSRHSAIGVGDAENDHALLDVCEVGVAVSDAVPSLHSFADLVMTEPDGRGVAELLESVFGPHPPAIHSGRWKVRLGAADGRRTASVPSSQMNILICGESGTGKSHLVGLFAERVIGQGYCVLVLDPEGDHQDLGRLRGVAVLNAERGLPKPARIAEIFSQRFTSVVLDMSGVDETAQRQYLQALASVVEQSRAACGLPHWIIGDEAHSTTTVFADSTVVAGTASAQRWGFALATYRPDLIDDAVIAQLDAVITMGDGRPPSPELAHLLARTSRLTLADVVEAVSEIDFGNAYLAIRPDLGYSTPFQVGSRVTEHRRHWHKYTELNLPEDRSFHFRNRDDEMVGVASNLRSLTRVLTTCSPDVIEHHARGHDLSRWMRDVFVDPEVTDDFADVEDRVCAGTMSGQDAGIAMARSVHRRFGV
ncbi:MAG: HAD family hydrolase [Actinomycetes bacterium]